MRRWKLIRELRWGRERAMRWFLRFGVVLVLGFFENAVSQNRRALRRVVREVCFSVCSVTVAEREARVEERLVRWVVRVVKDVVVVARDVVSRFRRVERDV